MKRVFVWTTVAIAIATISGCVSYSQSDQSLWRDPPNYSAVKTALPPARAPAAPIAASPQAANERVKLERIEPSPTADSSKSTQPTTATETPSTEAPPMPAAAQPAASAVPVSMYLVNANEQTTMRVLRRWARIDKVDFSWSSDVDYPLTPRMRAIEASTLAAAVNEIRAALEDTRAPLTITLDQAGLAISRPKSDVALAKGAAAPPLSAPRASLPPAPVATKPTVLAMPAPPQEKPWDAAARKAAGVMPAQWSVGEGRSLRTVVERWAQQGGVRVQWASGNDFPVSDGVRAGTYSGTFKEALGQLSSAFGQLPTPLSMKFLENGAVLRVVDAGGT
jgi:hypothetical protein